MRSLLRSGDCARGRLDANPVGRSCVGCPPRAFVEPDLAMPAAGVDAVNRDVAPLVLADRIAMAGRDGREVEATDSRGVLDFDRDAACGERRLRGARSLWLPVTGSGSRVALHPAPEQRHP